MVKKERKITKTETRIQYSIGNQLKNLRNVTMFLTSQTSRPLSFCTCADGIQPVMSRGLEWTNQSKERQIRTKELHFPSLVVANSLEPEEQSKR